MRAIAIIRLVAVAGAFAAFVSSNAAKSQSSNNNARCLSISNIDQRVACLESMAAGAKAEPPPQDRDLDCRNPQDTAECRELERQQGIQGTARPSFDCAKATYPDERAICSNAELSQLDNVANAGYEYVRRTNGAQFAKSATLPLLLERRACGSDVVCIKSKQLAAIQKFKSLGAPVNSPQIVQSQPLLRDENKPSEVSQPLQNSHPDALAPSNNNWSFASTILFLIFVLAIFAALIWFLIYVLSKSQVAKNDLAPINPIEEPAESAVTQSGHQTVEPPAFKPCRGCGAQVSTEAAFCPHCGVRSPPESTKLSGPTKPFMQKRMLAWAASIVAAVFLFWLFGGVIWTIHLLGADALLGVDTESALSNDIPKCNSMTAVKLAKEALAGTPLFKPLNITVFEIRNAQELSYNPADEKRLCTATAYLNSGKHAVQYTVEWHDKKAGAIWVEVKLAN